MTRRAIHWLLPALLSILPATGARAFVGFQWVEVGDPGNADDPQWNRGAVDSTFWMAKEVVTVADYVEFLNAKAATDPLELYHGPVYQDIERSGTAGSYSYAPSPGHADFPVKGDFWDAVRFVNWLHNGQGDGDTETGAYTLLGGNPVPSNAETVARNPEARRALPGLDEWHKAAYYDHDLLFPRWYLYPTTSDQLPNCESEPGPGANHAFCINWNEGAEYGPVGSFPNTSSPYGFSGLAGNGAEWHDHDLTDPSWSGHHFARGGASPYYSHAQSVGRYADGTPLTLRIVALPEPGPIAALAALAGLAGLARRRGAGRPPHR